MKELFEDVTKLLFRNYYFNIIYRIIFYALAGT